MVAPTVAAADCSTARPKSVQAASACGAPAAQLSSQTVAVHQPRGDGILIIEVRQQRGGDQCSVQGCYREATTHTTTNTGIVVPLCYACAELVAAWHTDTTATPGHRLGRGW